MEMKRINAGKLRAIGYDPRERSPAACIDQLSNVVVLSSPHLERRTVE
jgi:hypothetical protein